jgi:integrase/recombinase XerD
LNLIVMATPLDQFEQGRDSDYRRRTRRDSTLCGVQCDGALEKAQQMAAHESPKTTKLYDRTSDAITLDEVERIAI